jgi:hypothetical protein
MVDYASLLHPGKISSLQSLLLSRELHSPASHLYKICLALRCVTVDYTLGTTLCGRLAILETDQPHELVTSIYFSSMYKSYENKTEKTKIMAGCHGSSL